METNKTNTSAISKEEKATIEITKSTKIAVDSLGVVVGELKDRIEALPSDYVKSKDLERIMTGYFQTARIYSSTVTARVPDSLTEEIHGLKKAFQETRAEIEKSLAGIKPRKPLLTVRIGNKFLLVLTVLVLLAGAVGGLIFLNSPAHLANTLYELSTELDEADPGLRYHEAYTRGRNGKRREVKAKIKALRLELSSNEEVAAIIDQLLGDPVIVSKIIYGTHNDKLAMLRFIGQDAIWRAYFTENGHILITDSPKITTPWEAENHLAAKDVEWTMVR